MACGCTDCLHDFVLRGQKAGWFRPGRPEVLVRAMLALPIYYVLQRQVFGTPVAVRLARGI